MTASGLVAVVTDSTATLPPVEPVPTRVIVVPLRLLAGELLTDDGAAGAADAIEAAAARGERLTTARPVPGQFTAAYRAAADAGATAILSVHVSESLSGTISSAALAAAGAPVPVLVLDSRTIGSGLGLVVLAAAAAAGAGLGLDAVAAVARQCAEHTGSLVAVDRPDALLAGGRVTGLGAAERTAGLADAGRTAGPLVSRTVLELRSGRIAVIDRVRTWTAAARVLADSAAAMAAKLAAGDPQAAAAIDVVVEHVAAEARAATLAARLRAGLPQATRVWVVAAGSAIRIHSGQPMLGVSVAPSPAVG